MRAVLGSPAHRLLSGSLVVLAMAFTGDTRNAIFGWRSTDSGKNWAAVDTTALGPNKTGSVASMTHVPGVGLMDGAMGEGAADVLAALITGDHGMGRGFFKTDKPLRDLDEPDRERVWPDDAGEIHITGIIFGAAFWDLRTAAIAALGEADGVALVQKLYVATKVPPKNRVWPGKGTTPVHQVFPYDYIIEMTEKSRRNLGVSTIDLQQLHVWSDAWVEDDGWQRAARDLKKNGVIQGFGISINRWEAENVLKALDTDLVDAVQVVYNVFDQAPEDRLFPVCQEKRVAVIARVPFDEGSLTGTLKATDTWPKGDWRNLYFTPAHIAETLPRVRALQELVPEGRSLPDLALRFILHHPAVSTTIPGMRSLPHVESNIAASSAVRVARSIGAKRGRSRPASRREKSRSAFTSFRRRSALSWARVRRARCVAGRTAVPSASASSSGPSMSVSGVRSSWLTLLKNAVLAASSSPSFAFAARSSALAVASSRLRRSTSCSIACVRPRSSSPSSLACTSSVTSSARWMMYATAPPGPSTGEFTALQYRSSNPPPAPTGRRMSCRCTGMASATR